MSERRGQSVHGQNAALITAYYANPENYNTWLIATCTIVFLLGLDIALQFIFFLGEFHMASEDVFIRAIQSGSVASTFFIAFCVPGVKSLLELWKVFRWVNLVFNLGFLAESNLGISSVLGRSDA
ncbi:hypothetical protein J7T55_012374 [Diaporthe amygdali]|uniref:uncharacterized protein n=1 Tax=Phomopsis amygdali TaxID=1214568 RepID=UPI0022FE5EB0|nr:uncharacterized protein J7T55_012374 [Diaporthe amygdali]KAJ0123902.1 hypothetical protein J7T55_012374 [Diaporthe amygdali]